MKGQNINTLIGLMVAIVVGIAVTTSVTIDQMQLLTTTTNVNNQTANVSSSPNTNTTVQLSNFPVINGTVRTFRALALPVVGSTDVNYSVNHWTGVVTFDRIFNASGAAIPSAIIGFNYTYSDRAYLTDSTARIIARQLPLLVIVAILVLGIVGAIYTVMGRR